MKKGEESQGIAVITFRLPDREKQALARYCERHGRTQTDVIRELIRSLDRRK